MKTTFTNGLIAALIAVIGIGQTTNAQIIFSEDFASGIPGTWTTIDNDGQTVNSAIAALFPDAWNGNQDADDTTDIVAASTSWYDPAGTSDDWLITPAIALTSNNTLAWEEKAQDPDYPDGYELRISTTTPTIAAFNANAALFTIAAGSGGAWISRSVDLQALGYANQTVYFAWWNNSTDQFILDIDDVVVSAPIIGGGCDTTAFLYTNLNTAGGAPCFDGVTCVPTDPAWTTFGVYGSESYLLDNVQAGFDYVFDMCSGFGALSWTAEIRIIAPDGTTIDATNEQSSGSGATPLDQCSLAWTATQTGTYTIMINEMGTNAGDAPNQVDCITTYAVNNGNPTVLCGANPFVCLPCAVSGTLTSATTQDVCPGDSMVLSMTGNSSPTNYTLGFDNPLGGTGAAEGPFTVSGWDATDFPLMLDNDLNGILSANLVPTLLGTWTVTIYAVDALGAYCDSTVTTAVTFLDENDPACNVIIGLNDAANAAFSLYPNPSNGNFTIEMTGVETVGQISIVDLNGRSVYEEGVFINSNFKKTLDLDLTTGSYILRITTESDVITSKLTVK